MEIASTFYQNSRLSTADFCTVSTERGFEIRRITRRRKASDFPDRAIGGGFQIRAPFQVKQLNCTPVLSPVRTSHQSSGCSEA
jgi:hypothetical protein